MKPIEYVFVDADSRGTTYLLECLAAGHTLAKAVALSIAAKSGRVKTCVPSGLTTEQVHEFRWSVGGTMSGSQVALASLLTSLAGPDTCVVAESPIEQPDDPGISEWPARTFRIENELYAYLSGDPSCSTLVELLKTVDSPHECTVVLAGPGPHFPRTAGIDAPSVPPVDPIEVQSLAPLTRLVSVRAYDGEGYVLWLSETGLGCA